MIPKIDSQIGISIYSTTTAGIGGRIKFPEDFEVSEVIFRTGLESIKPESGYAVYRLKKRNIDSCAALPQ